MTSSKNSKAIALELIPEYIKAYFDSLTETEKAEFFGFGRGARADIDAPTCIALPEEHHITKGNAGIMIGLDRPSNMFSGFGGMKNTHCAAIDIVAGRLGSRAVSKDAKGKLVEVDPNLKLDAARLYLSQKADIGGIANLSLAKLAIPPKTPLEVLRPLKQILCVSLLAKISSLSLVQIRKMLKAAPQTTRPPSRMVSI